MELKSSNKVDVNRWELEIAISSEDFSKEVDKVYNRQKGKITVPGFRKGKAPRKFIEKYYGEQVFYEDAVNAIYPYALEDAAKEAGIELVDDHIDFEIVKMNKEEGYISSTDLQYLVGKKGVVTTDLHPAGKVRIEDVEFDVISDGAFLEKGTLVEIYKISNSSLVVRKARQE